MFITGSEQWKWPANFRCNWIRSEKIKPEDLPSGLIFYLNK